jgi:hypothetical protein
VKKIKYQGAITKILAEKIAANNKKRFLKNRESIFNKLPETTPVDFDVISFSGTSSFEDQLLSIYSFMYYAGIPKSWIIYSDKSYTTNQKDFFRKHFAFVSVADWDVFTWVNDYTYLDAYLKFCHLAKKVNVILGHSYTNQTIYADSDVIFYSHISHYLNGTFTGKGLWYISDVLDNPKNSSVNRENIYPLNSGFLILNNEFNKQDVITYFENLQGDYHYFSEQSSFDFALKKQDANILDPREFIVDTADQFDFSTKYFPDKIAMRHYVSPVRHKMWQNGWKWHFEKDNRS